MSMWWLPELRAEIKGRGNQGIMNTFDVIKANDGFVETDYDNLLELSRNINAGVNVNTDLRSVSNVWRSAVLSEMFFVDIQNINQPEEELGEALFDIRNKKIENEWRCLLAAYALADSMGLKIQYQELKLSPIKNKGESTVNPDTEYKNIYAKNAAELKPNSTIFKYKDDAGNNVPAEWKNIRLVRISGAGGHAITTSEHGFGELAFESPTTIVIPASDDWKFHLRNALKTIKINGTTNGTYWQGENGEWDFVANAEPDLLARMLAWIDIKYNTMGKELNLKIIPNDPKDSFLNIYGSLGLSTDAPTRHGLLMRFRRDIEEKLGLPPSDGRKLNEIYTANTLVSTNTNDIFAKVREDNLTAVFGKSDKIVLPPIEMEISVVSTESSLDDWFNEVAYIDWIDIDDSGRTKINKEKIRRSFSAIHDDSIHVKSEPGKYRVYFLPAPLKKDIFEEYKSMGGRCKCYVEHDDLSSSEGKNLCLKYAITVRDKSAEKIYTFHKREGHSEKFERITNVDIGDGFEWFNGGIWPYARIPQWNLYFLHSQSLLNDDGEAFVAYPVVDENNIIDKSLIFDYEGGVPEGSTGSTRDGFTDDPQGRHAVCNFALREFPEYFMFVKCNPHGEDLTFTKFFGYVRMETNERLYANLFPNAALKYKVAVDLGTSATMCCTDIKTNDESHLNPGLINANLWQKLDFNNRPLMRSNMYFFGENSFSMPMQTVLFISGRNTNQKQNEGLVTDYRIHNTRTVPVDAKHSPRAVDVDDNLKFNYKDPVRREYFLGNIVLGVCLDARIKGRGTVEPYISYPRVFENFLPSYIGTAFRAFDSLAGEIGITISTPMNEKQMLYAVPESKAAAEYVMSKILGKVLPGQVCVMDIGGGTVDICYLIKRVAGAKIYDAIESSFALGGRELMVKPFSALCKEGKGMDHVETLFTRAGLLGVSNAPVESGIGVLRVFSEYDDRAQLDSDISRETGGAFMRGVEFVLGSKLVNPNSRTGQEVDIGEILAEQLSHDKRFYRASEEEDQMLRTMLSVGAAAVFYLTGKAIRQAGINDEKELVIQLTGNGAKIIDWMPEKETAGSEKYYFIRQMIMTGIGGGITEKRVKISYAKETAKEEVAIGMLSSDDKKIDIVYKDSSVDAKPPISSDSSGSSDCSGGRNGLSSEITEFLEKYNELADVLNKEGLRYLDDNTYKGVLGKIEITECESDVVVTSEGINGRSVVIKLSEEYLEEDISIRKESESGSGVQIPDSVYEIQAILGLLRQTIGNYLNSK